jgi:hypothetical protein
VADPARLVAKLSTLPKDLRRNILRYFCAFCGEGVDGRQPLPPGTVAACRECGEDMGGRQARVDAP